MWAVLYHVGRATLALLTTSFLMIVVRRTLTRRASASSEGERTPPAWLVAADGTARPILQGEAAIGRDPEADEVIAGPSDTRVNRQQARVFQSVHDQQWYLVTVGTQPVRVDGHTLPPHNPVRLMSGATIVFANGTSRQFALRPDGVRPVNPWRLAELGLLGACSVLLFLGLLVADIGLRLDAPDFVGPSWAWRSLWATYTLGLVVLWGGMCGLDQLHIRRASPVLHSYPHPAVLPLVALLIAMAVMVGYRGEGVPLTPLHVQALRAAQIDLPARRTRMLMGDTMQLLRYLLGGLGLALVLRGLAVLIPNGARAVLTSHRLVRFQLPVPTILVAGPLGIGVLSGLLLLGKQTGYIQAAADSGQVVAGQPAEIMRLLIFATMVGLSTYLLRQTGPLHFRVLLYSGVCLIALLAGSALFYTLTADLGPLLLSCILTLGLAILPFPRKLLVLLLFVAVVALPPAAQRFATGRAAQNQRIQVWLHPIRRDYPTVTASTNFCAAAPANKVLCGHDESLRQAQYAVALGGVVGTGAGRGSTIPPLGTSAGVYIANIHSDYVFVQILEEYGLVGGAVVLATFFMLCLYCFRLSQGLAEPALRVLAAGCGLWWASQVLIITAGTTRLQPLIGGTVPFVSYGKASALVQGLILGLLFVAAHGRRVALQEGMQQHWRELNKHGARACWETGGMR